MPYLDRSKHNALNLRRMKAAREAWLADKSCWKCGTKDNLQLEWNGVGEKNHRVWSLRPERRAAILANYKTVCGEHKSQSFWMKPEQIKEIEDAFHRGLGLKASRVLLGHCQSTIERHLKKLGLKPTERTCGCGRNHKGICWWRLTLDDLRRLERSEQEELRQWQRAKAILNKLKARLRTMDSPSARKSHTEG